MKHLKLSLLFLLCVLMAVPVSAKRKTKVIAHRGYWKTEGAAQNSIRSLERANEIKVYGSEFDVHLTADNVPVVYHDRKIEGKDIQTASYAELKDLKLSNGETLPTLEQYLDRAKKLKKTKLIFELKSHATPLRDREAAKIVVDMVNGKKLTKRTEYIAFSLEAAMELHRLSPKTPVYYLNGDLSPKQLKELGFAGLLVPNPGYPTYTSLSKILGAEVINYNLKEENGWMPDFDELEKMDMSRVKLMWTNYPNMPTGANATPELYAKLVDFARRKDIVIVNDNPYSFILNDHPLSILSVPGAKECCIEFNSMSKSHNMPGWRIGMLASNADFVQWILKVKSNIDSGMFRAMQLAAANALEAEQEWYDGNNKNYRNRRHLAGEIMHALGCTYDEKQVGMFLWGKIPDSCADVEELTEKVLHNARVFITPGFIFGSNGKRYIRISLCCKDHKLEEALKRIREMK